MNLFEIFEDRMHSIFEGNRAATPLPFKKLAKQAVRQMKRNAVKINGEAQAPLLYTVLVNPADDVVIAPLYQQITDEVVDFVVHEAQNNGLVLTENPVVRFMPFAKTKPGHFDVLAEAVSHGVLESLRVEESTYAHTHAHAGLGRGGAVRPQSPLPGRQRTSQQQNAQGGLAEVPAVSFGAPAVQDGFDVPATPVAPVFGGGLDDVRPTPEPRTAPTVEPATPAPAPRPVQPAATGAPRTCELRDAASGRVWRIGVASTVIGRDEATADLVLSNSNVSRRHAELTSDASGWHLADLGSTNGTRVNGMRVTSPVDLRSGDTIALGLLTLEFREL